MTYVNKFIEEINETRELNKLVNYKDSKGQKNAVRDHNIGIVKELIKLNVDLHKEDNYGFTPYSLSDGEIRKLFNGNYKKKDKKKGKSKERLRILANGTAELIILPFRILGYAGELIIDILDEIIDSD